jgi:hypothetical protein
MEDLMELYFSLLYRTSDLNTSSSTDASAFPLMKNTRAT